MPIKIHALDRATTTAATLTPLVEVEWLAYSHPPNPLLALFFPVTSASAHTTAFTESVSRQLSWLKDDPSAHWIQAVDSDTGAVVGAALWYFCEKNPFEGGGHAEEAVSCVWYEGEGREMANMLMGQFLGARMRFMGRPHAFLNILFTHPSHRRRGVGKALVAWGLEKADALNLETYLDATEMGAPLYESCGFVRGERMELVLPEKEKEGRGERWRELEGVLLPFEWWPMWRGRGGRTAAGEGGKTPWHGE